ncbi:MAG: VWA domain-containing protein [Bryobacteraceae bacterium]|nr:VWA domain-containing protein [Bryobacteraceae bacterium]MDW8379284.1 VWA domain-containing protein [Bryobacterales bacterium]
MKSTLMRKLFVSLASVTALALGLLAQSNPSAPSPAKPDAEDPQNRIILDVTRVNILYTVSDKKGRFVTNLTKDDFEVFENKKRQTVLEFTAESDLPLRLALLIDTSNSVRDRFRFEQEAAIEFLNSLLRPRVDRAMVVSFDTAPELVADFTDDHEKLVKAIRDLRPGGGTALYDAIFMACRDRLMRDQPRHKFRRAIVILSDGDDNQSRYTREQALEMAQKADAVIYTISTNITRVESDGDKILKYFAQETGGLALFPFKVEDLAQSFENISNELRSQYNLLYRPDPLHTDGLYHRVEIRVKSRKDLIVRARKGYYAPRL